MTIHYDHGTMYLAPNGIEDEILIDSTPNNARIRFPDGSEYEIVDRFVMLKVKQVVWKIPVPDPVKVPWWKRPWKSL